MKIQNIGFFFCCDILNTYVIEKAYKEGTYQLIDAKGERPMPPINDRFLNRLEQNFNRMEHRFDQMETRWDTFFGPSGAFYAAYGPHVGQSEDEDDEDEDED